MDGIQLITQERYRQKAHEGWTAEHDDQHENGELSIAAACYAVAGVGDAEVLNVTDSYGPDYHENNYSDAWPWAKKWDKRKKHDRLRRLVIAGALIAAEIDRELRKPMLS